jgi:hypothetical protein
VPVATAVVGDAHHAAVVAPLDMATERCRPARRDGGHDPALVGQEPTTLGSTKRFTVAAKNVRHLQRGSHLPALLGRNDLHSELIERARRGGLYFWKQLPPTISPQTEYAGIRLGMAPDEVLSINGSPPAVYGEEEKEGKWRGFQPIVETKNLEKGKVVKDYRVWSYEQSSNHIDVTFNPEKTAVVAIACYSIDRQGRRPSVRKDWQAVDAELATRLDQETRQQAQADMVRKDAKRQIDLTIENECRTISQPSAIGLTRDQAKECAFIN